MSKENWEEEKERLEKSLTDTIKEYEQRSGMRIKTFTAVYLEDLNGYMNFNRIKIEVENG